MTKSPTKRKAIPEAPPEVSEAIDKLAEVRATKKSLAKQVKTASKTIIAFGPCHNDVWRAYIRHQNEGISRCHRKARTSVLLKPMNKEKP